MGLLNVQQFSNDIDILGDESLTKWDWDNHKWTNSAYLRFKVPKIFLEIINPDNKENSLLNNYCQIITKTKNNIRVFKINLSLAITLSIINFIFIVFNLFLLIFESEIKNINSFLFGILGTWLLSTFLIYSFYGYLSSWFAGKQTHYNNYKIHWEYLRCKFAIALNTEQEKNNDLSKVRKLFKEDLYKFIDENKLIFLDDTKVKYKNYSKFTKWFLMYGCIIINEILQWSPFVIVVLSLYHSAGGF